MAQPMLSRSVEDTTEGDMTRRYPISWLFTGAGLGAVSVYLLDPRRGRRRRHGIEDRLRGAASDIQALAGKARRDVENRARGLAARARGSRPTRAPRRHLLSRGTPERRLLEGGVGSLLALWGVARGGLVGFGAAAAGASLIACAAVPRQDGIIRVQKTLTIQAPIDQVFEFWSRFDNFPRFMEHVQEVRSDGDRSHWRVSGPAGIAVEWEAEVTEQIPNRKIAWRSVEGSAVEHHGEVHFEPIDDHQTRISILMAYNPPGGALGHAVAGFLQGDPKTLMDDDLQRVKSLLERGKTTAGSREVTAGELHGGDPIGGSRT
jgi:uncharacterized membrane protein